LKYNSSSILRIGLVLLVFQGCRTNDEKEAEAKGHVLEDSAIMRMNKKREELITELREGEKKESVDEYNARKRAEALKADSLKKVRGSQSQSIDWKRAGAWYEGGNLHRSKISDWKKSTDGNRLATCADFIAKIKIASNENDLLVKSTELRSCINEATRGLESTNNENVADVAALCVVTLGYQ
jgi:predicted AlkP superfamily phosphohydrolase/phosphomutase